MYSICAFLNSLHVCCLDILGLVCAKGRLNYVTSVPKCRATLPEMLLIDLILNVGVLWCSHPTRFDNYFIPTGKCVDTRGHLLGSSTNLIQLVYHQYGLNLISA